MLEHNRCTDDTEGMTDCQYKGMLIDQLSDWQEILDLAIAGGNKDIQERVEEQIALIHRKLEC